MDEPIEGPGLWQLITDPDDYRVCATYSLDVQRSERARELILWDAYLSQVPGREARQALETQVEERFRIIVVDPDFLVEPGR